MAKKNSSLERHCSTCKQKKSIESFPSHKGRPLNKGYRCKKCASELSCEYILKRYGSFRNANMFKKYKMSPEDYNSLLENQQGLCSLCKRERTLVIDHSHTTGKVRGLICSGCNTGIGQFEHDLSLFDKAKAYLTHE